MINDKFSNIILGIDPGLAATGWGVIKKEKSRFALADFGCITTLPQSSFPERLKKIHEALKKIIKRYQPSRLALEELFFAKNVKTALKISEVRGVIQLTAMECRTPVIEFTPLQVKQALVGYGRADKNQIQKMVKLRLCLKEIPKPDHAADALAVAITCAQTNMAIS